MARAVLTTLIFVAFTVYSLAVAGQEGFLSAFDVARQGGWNTQVFLDLCIALVGAATWMRADAEKKSLPFWPFALGCIPLGSVSLLAYASLSAWSAVKHGARRAMEHGAPLVR